MNRYLMVIAYKGRTRPVLMVWFSVTDFAKNTNCYEYEGLYNILAENIKVNSILFFDFGA